MAGSQTCYSPKRNYSPGKDELPKGYPGAFAPIKSSGPSIHTLAMSHTPSLALPLTPTPAISMARYTEKNK